MAAMFLSAFRLPGLADLLRCSISAAALTSWAGDTAGARRGGGGELLLPLPSHDRVNLWLLCAGRLHDDAGSSLLDGLCRPAAAAASPPLAGGSSTTGAAGGLFGACPGAAVHSCSSKINSSRSGLAGSTIWRRLYGGSSSTSSGGADSGGEPVQAAGSKPTGTQHYSTSGRPSQTVDPQPLLQAWLQRDEQGLSAEEADWHARRLAHVFGSEQAALDVLPATYAWCRDDQGLSGLQTAQVLDRIAKDRWENVVKFSGTAQMDWQLIDEYICAFVGRLVQAGKQLPKHTRLAEVMCSSPAAANALRTPPGHVAAWLEAVQQRLPAADLGAMLLSNPALVTVAPATSVAVINWVEAALRPRDLAAVFRKQRSLLRYNPDMLAAKLVNLQQAAGLTAEQARELALKQPQLLTAAPGTVQQSAAWLRQQFPDPVQLFGILNRGPLLLTKSVDCLQRNADYLQHELEWSAGNNQLAAFIEKYPEAYATVDFSSPYVQAKLLFLTEVVGVDLQRCLETCGNHLHSASLARLAATYLLVKASPSSSCHSLLLSFDSCSLHCARQSEGAISDSRAAAVISLQERAPAMLRAKDGEASLSWIMSKEAVKKRCGLTEVQLNAHVRSWPRSEEGRRLLAQIRWVGGRFVVVVGWGGWRSAECSCCSEGG